MRGLNILDRVSNRKSATNKKNQIPCYSSLAALYGSPGFYMVRCLVKIAGQQLFDRLDRP